MANVLGKLFGDIADAIREKTGDTATMKPAEFPEKIGGIDVPKVVENYPVVPDFSNGDQLLTAPDGYVVKSAIYQKPETLIPENIADGVDIAGIIGTMTAGGSGGGGSLPAGVYWEPENIRCPTNYFQQWFEYAGELYAAALPYAGQGNNWVIHKYINGAWEQVVAETTVSLKAPAGDVYMVEYDGLMHFLGNDTSGHYTFDGTTIIAKNSMPGYCISACVHQGKLLAYVRSDGCIYQWDGATDAWSVVADIDTATYHYYHIFSANNSLYAVYKPVLYEIVDGTAVKVADLPNVQKKMYADGVKYIYRADANNSYGAEEVHAYDLVSKTDTLLGYAPNSGSGSSFLYSSDGVFRSINCNLGTSAYATTSLIMHIVEATE